MDFVGIEKLSLVDFDDYLSIVLFTNGCNYRCTFCHNKSLVMHSDVTPLDWSELKDYLKSRIGKIDAIVITGGEPLIHPDIVDKIKEIKQLGFLVKLDTNGTNSKLLIDLIENKLIDYVAIDIKNSFNKYVDITKKVNPFIPEIQNTISYLTSHNFPYEFRTTVIEEFHTLDDLIEIANTIKGCPKYVLQKYRDKEDCIEHGFHEIKEDAIKKYQIEIQKIIPNTVLRGY